MPASPCITKGVETDFDLGPHAKRDFVLCLRRICPEKGYHHAIDAARRARIGFVLAGELFRYPAHQQYFDRELAPRLGDRVRFIGPVGVKRKRLLLAAARALLVPSLVAETSSLVTMEAMACGTPVIAYASGALPEIVENGRTGFVVTDAAEMTEATHRVRSISRELCRKVAREQYNVKNSVMKYFEVYQNVADIRSNCETKGVPCVYSAMQPAR